jgi:DNA-binding CsgD family transcriptional regulator
MQPAPAPQGESIRSVILSNREHQVLLLICGGLQAKEIAQRLGISRKTVEFHRANLCERLGIKETALLVRYAIRAGLIEP